MPGRVSRITVGERTIIWCSSTCRKTDAPRESVNRKFKPLDACSLHAAPPAETRQPERQLRAFLGGEHLCPQPALASLGVQLTIRKVPPFFA